MGKNHKAPPNKRARILIVDDHPAVREGLALRISRQQDMEVCGEASDVGEALRCVANSNPDVAIVDVSLRTGHGLDLIKRIKARGNSIPILVWSMHSESLYAERALRAGAMGYITKEHATDKIIAAIRRVLDGKVYLSDSLAESLLNRAVGKGRSAVEQSPIDILSDRELEVFQFLGQGLDTQQIAERMHISPKTVETYRARLKEKLNLTSGSELLRKAMQWVLESA
jgi:DNA-binding NarL/FixJ family response regulator